MAIKLKGKASLFAVCMHRFSFHEFYNFFYLICYFFVVVILLSFYTFFMHVPMTFTQGDFYFIKLIFWNFFLFFFWLFIFYAFFTHDIYL